MSDEFSYDARKETSDGTWLMSLYEKDDSTFSDYAHIYKNSAGEITIYQYANRKKVIIHGNPRFINKFNSMTNERYVWYSSYRHSNDSNGTYITVSLIKMNEELTKKALNSSAMKQLYTGGKKTRYVYQENAFLIDYYHGNPDVPGICAWLSGQFGKPLDTTSRTIKMIVGIAVSAALLITLMFSCTGGGGGGSTATCKSCGRTFQAGDSGGNYKNIARTGMCNNCYGNYQWGQNVLGN